jgi:glycosyltransferase involved in cell wall biosynthesis
VEIILDLSRLLSRALHATPTGIDRVEMVYARALTALLPGRLRFAAVDPLGRYGRLPNEAVARFLDETEARWSSRGAPGRRALLASAALNLARLRPRRVPRAAPGTRRYYVQASPHHLDRPARVRAKLRAEGARLICLVHDLIPIEYPEYARPSGAATHRRRIETMADCAAGLIANSHATARSMLRFLDGGGRTPPIRVAHLGCDPLPPPDGARVGVPSPYFVVVSTIEPRKNHLLLLNVWRRLSETVGAADMPHLAIVGRRGWENENIVDMLERCPAIRGHVHEFADLSDREVGALLHGARALLCPSFAEGFGMPVTEALVGGTPVICSDLPALREAGGDVPDFIDPLDGPEWIEAIMDYRAEDSARRARQLERLGGWTAPSWRAHVDAVIELVAGIDAEREDRP